MASEIEVAWLAGLLEGEACFTGLERTPRVDLVMTDGFWPWSVSAFSVSVLALCTSFATAPNKEMQWLNVR